MISRLPTKSPSRRAMPTPVKQGQPFERVIQEESYPAKEIDYELIEQMQETKKKVQKMIVDLRRTLKSNEKSINYEELHLINEERAEKELIKAHMIEMIKNRCFEKEKWNRYKELAKNERVRKLYEGFKQEVQGSNSTERKQLNTELSSLYSEYLQKLENQIMLLSRGQQPQDLGSLQQKIDQIQKKIDKQDLDQERQELPLPQIHQLIKKMEHSLINQYFQLNFEVLGKDIQLKDATALIDRFFGLSFTEEQIENTAREYLDELPEPINFTQKDCRTLIQKIYSQMNFLKEFNRKRLQLQALKYYIMYYDYDGIDKVPQDRGTENTISLTVGEPRQKYDNEISIVASKKKNYKYQNNLIISLQLEDQVDVNQVFCQNIKQKLLEVLKMVLSMIVGEQAVQLILKMFKIEVNVGGAHLLVLSIDIRGYEIDEFEYLINGFTDQIFYNDLEFDIEAKFEFQKNLLHFFTQQIKQETQVAKSTGFLTKDAKFLFKLEINEVISILKQYAKTLTVFDDLQYKAYAPSALIPLLLLSTQSTSTQFEFENFEVNEENFDENEEDVIESGVLPNRKIKKIEKEILGMLGTFIETKKGLEESVEVLKILDDAKNLTIQLAIGTLLVKVKLQLQEIGKILQIDSS